MPVPYEFHQAARQTLAALERLHRRALLECPTTYRAAPLCTEAEAAIVGMLIAIGEHPSAPPATLPASDRRRPGGDPFNTAPRRRKSDWPELSADAPT